MPFTRHRDFRVSLDTDIHLRTRLTLSICQDFYRKIPLPDLKCYFRCMFSALESVHEFNIMHRDVKPANFLYDPTTGYGVLCDFGLAEVFNVHDWRGKCHHTAPTESKPHGDVAINRNVHSIHLLPGHQLGPKLAPGKRAAMPPPERVGYLNNDMRPVVRANRAGTRGFRAPEVLFKCQDQTVCE